METARPRPGGGALQLGQCHQGLRKAVPGDLGEAFLDPMEVIPHRCWVEVSLPQIAENFRRVRSVVGPDVEITAVVKADAYGHGMPQVARALSSAGARSFAVSCVPEGIALREAGIAGRILVMADSMDHTRAMAIDHNLTPVVHTLEDL